MSKNKTIRTDPLVKVQKRIDPVRSAAMDMLLQISIGFDHPIFDTDPDEAALRIERCFADCEAVLDGEAEVIFAAIDIPFTDDTRAACQAAARLSARVFSELSVAQARARIKAPKPQEVARLGRLIRSDFRAAIGAAVDALREVFITAAVRREAVLADHTEIAVRRLTDVSRQIDFIAINASIEAARAGEHGKGFAVISGEIRALSRGAQQTTRELARIIGSTRRVH